MVTASVDVGGTFTDVVIQRDNKIVSIFKTRTTTQNPEEGVLSALRQATRLEINEIVHATTLATNALLTGQVSDSFRTGLVTTEGFRDVIEIGRQNRSELYNLGFDRRRPLVPAEYRHEVERRVYRGGKIESQLRRRELARAGSEMKRAGVVSVAISFLHSYSDPKNEKTAARLLRRRFRFVSVSSEIAPEPREYERTSSTVVNAVLMPVVSDYIRKLRRGFRHLRSSNLTMMSSAGGLIPLDEVYRRPVQVIESGPAAGVVATSELAKALGIRNAISFDMGGTTAKAGTIRDGSVGITSEFEVGGTSHHGRMTKGSGYPVRFPFVDLVEVSAGGGSIIAMDREGMLSVGPESAGAHPGPACYGLGGLEPTLTDANLVLGILGDSMLGGELKLDSISARRSLQKLGNPLEVAEDALRLADLEMARAIRLVTVERGLDPSTFSLIAFGGAGPQHAVRIAKELGIRRVVVPPRPGLFSAMGLLFSDWKFEARMAFPVDPRRSFAKLETDLTRVHQSVTFQRFADCRYSRQGSELTVKVTTPSLPAIISEFERSHEAAFGFRLKRSVEIVSIRVFALATRSKPRMRAGSTTKFTVGTRQAVIDGRSVSIKTYDRVSLKPGARVGGPCSVDDYGSSIFIPPDWRGVVGNAGEVAIEETRP